jgi:hypothetical protein
MAKMTMKNSEEIGHIIRDGMAYNARNWRGTRLNTDSIVQEVQNFFTVLEQNKIEYVLVGGIALLNYVEGRNTEDLDLLMASSEAARIPDLKIISEDSNFKRGRFGNLSIDILLTSNPLFKKVHKKYATVQCFLDREIPIATVEGLLLLKLYALPSLYRQGNFARVGIYENDVAVLLHDYAPNIPKLMTEISRHVGESDLTEIKQIMTDIQGRIQRFVDKV